MFQTSRIHSQNGLKHVDDVKNLKIELKYEFKSVHFIYLCCIITSQRTVQKTELNKLLVTLLSICKSGETFPFIEPSSAQFTNPTEGTFSRCAHCEIPNVYNRMTIKCINDFLVASIIL